MKNILSILSIISLLSTQLVGQVTFKASANKVVEAGENFRLNFTVNANGTNFKPPSFAGFRVLAGPSTSTSSSFQYINGKASQTISNTFSYIIQATKAGKFTISKAQITVDGKTYKSNTITIEVVKGSAQNIENITKTDGTANNVKVTSKDDIFVRNNLSKTTVYQGEQIISTIKVYTRVGLRAFDDFKFPSFTGFWSQDIKTPSNISLQRENVNGKIYKAGVLRQSVLFPQRSGTIKIDPFELTCIVQVKAGKRRNFFGELVDTYADVKKNLKSPARTVKVLPLPGNKPKSFSGAVGNDFQMQANIDRNEIANNESLTLKVKISGSGNLKLIDKINIDFPKTFEVYDPKISNNINNTASGARGSKTFEFLLIPREPGDYTIPAIKFSYFDVKLKSYKTLSGKDIPIHVDKSTEMQVSNNPISISKEDIKTLGTDIRFIKQNSFELLAIDKTFFGSWKFYMFYLISFITFILIVFISRHKIRQNANVVLMKNKRANKISKKRLKMASAYMKQNNQAKFYDEVIHALWGYLSDKLNIPVAELSRNTVKETLTNHKVGENIINEFIVVIDDCEYAKYAPASENLQIEKDYKKARDIINHFESFL
ncbi:MAG: BatD family protein [Bacteroidota bacterium]